MIDARKLIRSTLAGLSEKATRGFITDDTIDLLHRECPGWDLHALHAEFERWVGADQERTPRLATSLHRLGEAPPYKAPPQLSG